MLNQVMKRYGAIFCLVCAGLLLFAGICQAHTPQRVAILPVINQSYMEDAKVEAVISDSLYGKFKIPLAKVLNTYEFVPVSEIEAAFPEVNDRKAMKKFNPARLQQVAAQLDADLVIGGIISNLSEDTFTNFDGDLIQQTYLSIRLIGYDAREKKVIDVHDYENYDGDWTAYGEADYLAKKIMNHLLDKAIVTKK